MSRSVPPEEWTSALRGLLSGDPELRADLEGAESHPGRGLLNHLEGTAALVNCLACWHGLDVFALDALHAALIHDIGKVDPLFQAYLKKRGKGKGVEHAAPSASYALLLSKKHDEGAFYSGMLFSAEAVRRHHTRMESWGGGIIQYWAGECKKHEEMLARMLRLTPSLEERSFERVCRELNSFIWSYLDGSSDLSPSWLRLRLILSLLVAGDRLDALNVREIPLEPLPGFTEKVFRSSDSEMNLWRNQVARDCLQRAEKTESPGIFTLTLPTGAGKTYIGLKTAHLLAQKFDCRSILYALPFISIVEQNADFANEVFGGSKVQEDHSLVSFETAKASDDGGTALDVWKRARRLFRYWGAPVVVTTLAQLWAALYHPGAGASINFHRFARAVVLLDEPQGMDAALWDGFGHTLNFLHQKLGTVFILMTATQPVITPETAVELAPTVDFPFNRHRYRVLEGKYPLEDLPDLIKQHIPFFGRRSGMVVLNTRRSALKAYRMLRPLLKKEAFVCMLTRWMTPVHRRRTLNILKQRMARGKRCYLIATQVVEAGVDLDFDWVVRDLGPLDSIVQVAGRCNRNALREEGTVLIAELHEGEGKECARWVYEPVRLDCTRKLLGRQENWEERDMPRLVEDYYKQLRSKLNVKPVWRNIVKGKWGEYTPLFEERRGDVPVYVDYRGELDTLFEQLDALESSLENREEFKRLRGRIQQYAIEISRNDLEAWRSHTGHFIADGEEKLEFRGDDVCIIRSCGIGAGEGSLYHPVAGFQPFLEAPEDWGAY